MRHLILLVCIAATLSFVSVTHAKKSKDGGKGTQGTIATVGTTGFSITDKDDKTIDVICDVNTKFTQDGQPAKPDVIKVGAKVSVVGGADGTNIRATTVNIMSSDTKKKKDS